MRAVVYRYSLFLAAGVLFLLPVVPVFVSGIQESRPPVKEVMKEVGPVVSVQSSKSDIDGAVVNLVKQAGWEYEEEQAIVELYTVHYESQESESPKSELTGPEPFGSRLVVESLSAPAVSGGSARNHVARLSDLGAGWGEDADLVPVRAASHTVFLIRHYFSIRQGYADPASVVIESIMENFTGTSARGVPFFIVRTRSAIC